MTTLTVLSEDAGDGVRLLTLNRPAELNAWTYDLEAELFSALDSAAAATEVRVVVLTGAGRGFCAGGSMELLRRGGANSGPADATRRWPTELVAYPKPVVAALNGATAGIGLALAAACDVRFAATTAKLTTAFARRGLIAEHGTAWLLPRLVGRGHATELLLSGRVITGEEAERIGLVLRAVPPDAVLDTALEYARELSTTGCPASWATMKRQVMEAESTSLDAATASAVALMRASHLTDDFTEGVQSFLDRRLPHFAPYPRE
jgi:enoyl-CoA hydratase/carnithine racemase